MEGESVCHVRPPPKGSVILLPPKELEALLSGARGHVCQAGPHRLGQGEFSEVRLAFHGMTPTVLLKTTLEGSWNKKKPSPDMSPGTHQPPHHKPDSSKAERNALQDTPTFPQGSFQSGWFTWHLPAALTQARPYHDNFANDIPHTCRGHFR